MSDERTRRLAEHLAYTRGDRLGSPAASEVRMAAGILANPQALMDALVEGGVLERKQLYGGRDTDTYYRVWPEP